MTFLSPRSTRARVLVIAAVVAIVAVGTIAWYLNTPRGYVRRVFAATPAPPGSREVGRELRDWAEGPVCPYAQLLVVYESDRPWEQVADFYEAQFQQGNWDERERRILGTDTATNTAMEEIQASRETAGSRQSALTLTVVNFSQLSEVTRGSAQTLFTVGIEYIPDLAFFRSSELCQD